MTWRIKVRSASLDTYLNLADRRRNGSTKHHARHLLLYAVRRLAWMTRHLRMRSWRNIARWTSIILLCLTELVLVLLLLSHLLMVLVAMEAVHTHVSLLAQVVDGRLAMLLQILTPFLAELGHGLFHLLLVANELAVVVAHAEDVVSFV